MEAAILPLSCLSLLRPCPALKTPRLAIPRKSFRPLQVSGFPPSVSRISIASAASPSFAAAYAHPPQSHDAGEASVAEDDGENEVLSTLSGDSANIWGQMKEIAKFAGPATGLWICGPLMSLIDTAVIGQSSSLELAALGPGTVVCDSTSYVFMFLSIATSNMVATSLAKKDRNGTQHQISMLLFIAFACGLAMLFVTKFMGSQMLTAFAGPKNLHIVPAANTYVQIRGLAWPAILVGLVAQSASLGMKDSWGPLRALLVASLVNGFGDILLCNFLGYGIAGAAWATMVSQVVAAFMMIDALNRTGFSAFNVSIPSLDELLQIVGIAAPVFVTMISKVAFYSLLTYFSTSMGTITLAAHQVMIGVFCMCTVWGEPLSQTAQSFMPELIYGVNRNLMKVHSNSPSINNWEASYFLSFLLKYIPCRVLLKARMLLQSLLIIGALTGLALGVIGTSVPWCFPYIFTNDHGVVGKMHTVLLPYFVALIVTPPAHSLEGTLMAGRDLRFLSLSMSGCFTLGGLLLMLLSSRGFGLPGCWWALAGFQWARFSLALKRLISHDGVLYSDKFNQEQLSQLKAA